MIFAFVESGDRPAPAQYYFDLEFTGRSSLDPKDFFRWKTNFDRKQIPEKETVTVKVWAFDVTKKKAYPIKGSWQVLPDGNIVAKN